MPDLTLDPTTIFETVLSHVSTEDMAFRRGVGTYDNQLEVIRDDFCSSGATCLFMRYTPENSSLLQLRIDEKYTIRSLSAGGWLLVPTEVGRASYWIPVPPTERRLDPQGHVLNSRPGVVDGFDISSRSLVYTLSVAAGHSMDLVAWRIPDDERELIESLTELTSLERHSYFMWSSHTQYSRPADLYMHLVHGNVYENHEVWPKYWRVCSELDAYALYVTLTGLLRATGKKLYGLLRTQVVFSVIERQADDGGWYHGEWTDRMESHYRLHAGGMHLLAAYYEETRDLTVGGALQKAAAFAASRIDQLESGIWYLHDSLEESVETLKSYPFRYASSRALGKSESNLLVLNTHLDTNIAMERCRRVSGEKSHNELIASARASTRAVLNLRPADWLYRPLYKAIALTFLPSKQGAALPLPLRALKRIAWKYLVPKLPLIKARFPRLVMPDGFIERGLAQYGTSVRYQPVNLMDLIRTRRLFDESELDPLLEQSFRFTQQSGIKDRWKEFRGKEDDSLGFWAEALYHLCLAKPDASYRAWLAEAIIDLEDNGLGISPSLLGANAEAVAPEEQRPCPGPADARLRVANLGGGEHMELLVVNPSAEVIDLEWETALPDNVVWKGSEGTPATDTGLPASVPSRSWLCGVTQP